MVSKNQRMQRLVPEGRHSATSDSALYGCNEQGLRAQDGRKLRVCIVDESAMQGSSVPENTSSYGAPVDGI